MSLCLAYDGSINGDWVARYAICMAAHRPRRHLHAIHVETGEFTRDWLRAKLNRIEEECRTAGVTIDVETIPVCQSVEASLTAAVPPGPDSLLICGTRLRSGRRGYLAGTISEKLLVRHGTNVAVLRVVQPGLLGAPHDALLPVLGRPMDSPAILAFVRWLAPEIRRLHILLTIQVGRGAFRRLTSRQLSKFRRDGFLSAQDIEHRLIEETVLEDRMIDASVRVTDDWAKDTIIYASRHKSQLICLEAPFATATARLFRADPIERLLADAPCDVALFRGA
jgi:nucleotide-binding universal stress UspA family protein